MINLKKVEQISKTELKIFFDDTYRIFNITRMFYDDIENKNRWINLFNSGKLFSSIDISGNDLVWVGWCEIFNEDILKYTYKEITNDNTSES